ncbi:RrF2 family transcriptional regulator [Peredibacter sp. HCB2-198]|uniref:RrF2 family transcriptional regulator n=1 Tax=Peredibacter sp. HCB2-198 TaxID=3383025 RepID=UPI0038B5853A
MKLTLKTDYALRVLIFLQREERKVTIAEIAEFYDIKKNHLSVVVNRLSELGYVHTVPGPKGGIEFNTAMANKSVAEVFTSFEEMDMVECFNSETNTCQLSLNCKLKGMLSRATRAFVSELKGYKIKDLV